MRFFMCALLALLIVFVQGCALTPGQSPDEIKASHSSPGYIERSFDDMHPDIL